MCVYLCIYICMVFLFINVCIFIRIYALGASIVHASGTGQLQANPPVEVPRISSDKFTRRAVVTMRTNDLVVVEDHMVGPSCQRYVWQTCR